MASAAALLDALADGVTELVKDRSQHEDIIQTGHAPILVALMLQSHRGRQEKAVSSVCALCHAGDEAEHARDALVEAGAIPALVGLLRLGADSRATADAASAIGNLVFGSQHRAMAIQYAGAIPLLVGLLDATAQSKATASSLYAISVLAREEDIRPTIACGGAIPLLVRLMAAGAVATVAEDASAALWYLTLGSKARAMGVLDAMCSAGPELLLQCRERRLHLSLQAIAVDALRLAERTADQEGLRTAVDRAAVAGVDDALLVAARRRLHALATPPTPPEMAQPGGSARGDADGVAEASSFDPHGDARENGLTHRLQVDRVLSSLGVMPGLKNLGATVSSTVRLATHAASHLPIAGKM